MPHSPCSNRTVYRSNRFTTTSSRRRSPSQPSDHCPTPRERELTEMVERTANKERNFPKPEFTDSEAGALVFPSSTSRAYNYFTPAKLRATMYEDVTFDVQPDPERHLSQGWLYGFSKGPGGYPKDWTKLVSS